MGTASLGAAPRVRIATITTLKCASSHFEQVNASPSTVNCDMSKAQSELLVKPDLSRRTLEDLTRTDINNHVVTNQMYQILTLGLIF